MDNSYLDLEPKDESPMDTVLGHAITYRIAVGPNAGRKVFTLQTVAAMDMPSHCRLAKLDGFSLHAGVATEAHQRRKLERAFGIFGVIPVKTHPAQLVGVAPTWTNVAHRERSKPAVCCQTPVMRKTGLPRAIKLTTTGRL